MRRICDLGFGLLAAPGAGVGVAVRAAIPCDQPGLFRIIRGDPENQRSDERPSPQGGIRIHPFTGLARGAFRQETRSGRSPTMIKMSIYYPANGGSKFDHD